VKNKIRFAVIGCGHIGTRHAEMIFRNDETELVALCDLKPQEELGIGQYNVPFYAEYKSMLSALQKMTPDIQMVVSVCTPNGLHAGIAIDALEAGFHVVIEKPMALSIDDADLVIQKAREYNRKVFCVMQNRYSPPSQWLKEIVDSGILGRIYLVQVNCFWNRDERYYTPGNWHGTADMDGGTLFTQFSHFVDILYWLFGDIHNIHARFDDFNHGSLTDFEDSGLVTFDFVRGGMGSFHYSTSVWNKNLESSMTIVAENGSVKVGGQYMNEVEYCHIKDYTMPELAPTNPGNDYGAYKGSAQNHHYVIQNVVDVLHDGDDITTNAEEGRSVVSIIERIYSQK
jgi:Predicted dehydrogenases and related proteins